MKQLRERFGVMLDGEAEAHTIGFYRLLLGPILLLHLSTFIGYFTGEGWYGRFYSEPILPFMRPIPETLYAVMLGAGVIAAVLLALGLFSRTASIVAAVVVASNLLSNGLFHQHNRGLFCIMTCLFTLMPSGRAVALDAKRHSEWPKLVPLFPLLLMRMESMVPYLASGISKLIDPDWWAGTVTWARVEHQVPTLLELHFPAWFIALVTDGRFHFLGAKVVVLTELFIALGLLFRRTRLSAIWVAIVFHLTIEVSADVAVFGWLCLANTVLWVDPATRRSQAIVPERWLRVVRGLDWLARLDVKVGPRFELGELTGRSAVLQIARRLPVTFFFVYPLASIDGYVRRLRTARTSAAPRDLTTADR